MIETILYLLWVAAGMLIVGVALYIAITITEAIWFVVTGELPSDCDAPYNAGRDE